MRPALGQGLVIISGGIDLSVGATVGLGPDHPAFVEAGSGSLYTPSPPSYSEAARCAAVSAQCRVSLSVRL